MVSKVSGIPKWDRGCALILSELRMMYSRNSKPPSLCTAFFLLVVVVVVGLSVLPSGGESVKGKANRDIIRTE